MRLSKSNLVVLIALVTLAFWFAGQSRLNKSRRALEQARMREAELREHVSKAGALLRQRQEELGERNRQRDCALAAVARAEQDLEKAVPDSKWSEPPANLPEWNTASPYVWLRKDVVPLLSVPAFSDDGSVRQEVALVLNADNSARVRLNENLRRVLHEYQQLELMVVAPDP